MTILDFFRVPSDWTDFFYNDDNLDLLLKIEKEWLESEKDKINFLSPFYNVLFEKINVVIVTDSYENYSYSSQHISKPLQAIYRELEDEGFYPTKDGKIEKWAKDGVLLFSFPLMGIQTQNVFEMTNRIIHHLMKKQIIWVFLGEKEITNIPNSYSHNPMSKTFKGCNLFKNINKELYKKGKDKISW